MNVQTFYTKHKRPIIWIAIILGLALVLWFLFREVKGIQSENKAERELILKQRDEAKQSLITRDSLARIKEDSLIMEMLGIRTRVEYKIIERERYVTRFIDTASIRTKHKYLDSLLGPK